MRATASVIKFKREVDLAWELGIAIIDGPGAGCVIVIVDAERYPVPLEHIANYRLLPRLGCFVLPPKGSDG